MTLTLINHTLSGSQLSLGSEADVGSLERRHGLWVCGVRSLAPLSLVSSVLIPSRFLVPVFAPRTKPGLNVLALCFAYGLSLHNPADENMCQLLLS